METIPMARGSVDMNFLFTLGELARLVRAYADKQAARYGITRAQWAVLAKVERTEGLKQSELAELMEMQPITLTRLIDKLCDNGWIERRGDETDRRVNRLYLRKAARPLLGKLGGLRSELTATALEGISPADAHRLLDQLEAIKENVRNAIQNAPPDPAGHLRQDHQDRRHGRPAGRGRRRHVPDRSGAVRAGGGAGARQARRCQDQPRQPRRQRQALWRHGRPRQRRHRAQAARRRPQDAARQEQLWFAARPRQH